MTRSELGDRTVVAVGDPAAPPAAMAVGAPEDPAVRVSALDRGFLYGDAAFETVRCYDGEPALLGAHADRLRATLEELSVPVAPTDGDLRARIDRLLAALGAGPGDRDGDGHDDPDGADGDRAAGDGDRTGGDPADAYVRLSVTRGERSGVLAPTETDPTFVALAKPLPAATRRYPPAVVETVDPRRHDAPVYRLKTHSYLPGVLAKGALGDGADEALMRDADGRVASGAVSNVFVLRNGRLSTPSADRAVRPGVTRQRVLSLAADLGVETRTGPVESVADADGAVLTNATWGVRPVGRVDGRSLPVPDVLDRLAERYLDAVVPDRDPDTDAGGGCGTGAG